jgi:HEAT repeat protein
MAEIKKSEAEKLEIGLVRLRHHSTNQQLKGLAYLGRMGQLAQPAVPSILELGKSENPQIRKMVTLVLGEIGEPVDLVVPALIERLSDSDMGISHRAGVALSELIYSRPEAHVLLQSLMSTCEQALRDRIESLVLNRLSRQAA